MRFSKVTAMAILAFLICICLSNQAAEIHESAKSGDLERIRELIENDPHLINSKDENGRAPLFWACREKHENVAIYLIEASAEVNIEDKNNIVPLHYVAIHGLKRLADLLIDRGADINVKSKTGYTPLHYAAHYGQLGIAELLVDNGANVHLRNRYGRTPLVHAAREGGNAEIAELLIDHGADINVKDNEDWTPLDYAIQRGHKDVVRLLVKKGAVVSLKDNEGMEMLHRAARGGHMELARLLITKGADINSRNGNNGTLLHSAAVGGLHDLIKSLPCENYDPNGSNRYSLTPLHLAAMKGHSETAELLIRMGAEIDLRSADGKTPLYLARENGHHETAQTFIANGADTSALHFTNLHGKYFNQKRPGLEPELFAPGVISTVFSEHCSPAFSPDGKEVYFYPISGKGTLFMEMTNRGWTIPAEAYFSDPYDAVNPVFSPDGSRIYFKSHRPVTENTDPGSRYVWYVERDKCGWSEPKPFKKMLNLEGIGWQMSVTKNQHLYFTCDGLGEGIYRFPFIDGRYLEPEAVNTGFPGTCPAIAPDESYLIFVCTDRDDGIGGDDLYVSFRKKDGTWTMARNMGDRINTGSHELWPSVSPDGRYIFFVSFRNSNADVYWVSAEIIEEFRPSPFK